MKSLILKYSSMYALLLSRTCRCSYARTVGWRSRPRVRHEGRPIAYIIIIIIIIKNVLI